MIDLLHLPAGVRADVQTFFGHLGVSSGTAVSIAKWLKPRGCTMVEIFLLGCGGNGGNGAVGTAGSAAGGGGGGSGGQSSLLIPAAFVPDVLTIYFTQGSSVYVVMGDTASAAPANVLIYANNGTVGGNASGATAGTAGTAGAAAAIGSSPAAGLGLYTLLAGSAGQAGSPGTNLVASNTTGLVVTGGAGGMGVPASGNGASGVSIVDSSSVFTLNNSGLNGGPSTTGSGLSGANGTRWLQGLRYFVGATGGGSSGSAGGNGGDGGSCESAPGCGGGGGGGTRSFVDLSTTGHVVTVVGNAKGSRTRSKWATTSAEFDGNGDAVVTPSNAQFAMGTGAFTVEAWIYLVSGGTPRVIVSTRPTSAGSVTAFGLGVSAGGELNFYTSVSIATSTANVPTGQWVHVAATRSGNTIQLYIDGTADGSGTITETMSDQVLAVGGHVNGNESFNGSIQDVRITKGVARYAGNFSVPTAAYQLAGDPNSANVSLLLPLTDAVPGAGGKGGPALCMIAAW